MQRKYYVTEIEATRANNGYYVSYTYAGRRYWAQGEFYIDAAGYLHHSHITDRGTEKHFRVKVENL